MAADRDGKALGVKIRKFRELAGLSQTRLGELLGVSYQQVQKYERGASRMSVETLLRLARALNQPYGAFLPAGMAGGEAWHMFEPRPDYAPLAKEEKELLKAFREIGDDKVKAAFLIALKAASSRKH
jgi:transcriptional regulator with XRE-family HTH domain